MKLRVSKPLTLFSLPLYFSVLELATTVISYLLARSVTVRVPYSVVML